MLCASISRQCVRMNHTSVTGPPSLMVVPDVLPHFPPVRYAVAYGSSAFQQAGYPVKHGSMVDYVFAVESPHEWHRQNIAAHPSHYSFLRWLGANTVGQVQEKLGSGVYYNTLVTWDDRRIKYGVVSAARLRGDLRDWSDLYLAGRLHKPVITLKDDAEISVAKEANLENGVRTALLMLPEEFSEKQLFRTVAGLSYLGDWRMQAGENPDKVKNIVDSNMDHFRHLYGSALLANDLHTSSSDTGIMIQDISPTGRSQILAQLPDGVIRQIAAVHGGVPQVVADCPVELATYSGLAESPKLPEAVQHTIGSIVRRSSWSQSYKGVLTAGVFKTCQYLLEKWRTGRQTRRRTQRKA